MISPLVLFCMVVSLGCAAWQVVRYGPNLITWLGLAFAALAILPNACAVVWP